MRTDAIFKRAFNRCLEVIAELPLGARLESEHLLSRRLGVSRTTVRKVVEAAVAQGYVDIVADHGKVVRRHPDGSEGYPEDETELARDLVERSFMQLVQHEEISPGQQISTVDLARKMAVSPSVIREYLSGFSQFGLIERRSNGSWVFRGFDRAFARELSDVRELFELRSAELFADLPPDDPVWQQLDEIEARHRDLEGGMETRYREFSHLDRDFHSLINSVSRNRFVDNFNAIRSFVFHYHYQWSRADEKARNIVALAEHLVYIRALRSRDPVAIRAAAQSHLRTARLSLLASIERGRGTDDSAPLLSRLPVPLS